MAGGIWGLEQTTPSLLGVQQSCMLMCVCTRPQMLQHSLLFPASSHTLMLSCCSAVSGG